MSLRVLSCHPGNLHHSILHYIWISPTGLSISLRVCLPVFILTFISSCFLKPRFLLLQCVPLLLNLCMLRTDVSELCSDWCWLKCKRWHLAMWEDTCVSAWEKLILSPYSHFFLSYTINLYIFISEWQDSEEQALDIWLHTFRDSFHT